METILARLRRVICRTTLLGASVGIVVGLIEAAFLHFTDAPLLFHKPAVTPLFWFLAPLLTCLAFGVLGLIIGLLGAWFRHPFIVKFLVATLLGLSGAYFGWALQFSQQGSPWFIVLHPYMTPEICFGTIFTWNLLMLWATRKQGSEFGALEKIPLRSWAWGVSLSLVILVAGVTLNRFYHPRGGAKANAASSVTGPNIILIVWDTTRADHLSSYGYRRQTTPYLDQLARRGVLFENANSASSWTLPSIASIFTSLLPHQHGASSDIPLGGGPRTLAEILASRGYETAGFSGNVYYGLPTWGLAQGFETYVDSTETFGYNLGASVLGRTLSDEYGPSWFGVRSPNKASARYINQEIKGWLEQRYNRPYFLYVNYIDGHRPYQVPAPYNHLFSEQTDKQTNDMIERAKLGRLYFPPREREGVIAAYDNCLNYMDAQLEDLLHTLSSTPEWSNTYVILTSDHGEAFGEHDSYGHGFDLYREELHVPLIIAGPGIPEGVRISNVVQTRQLFATVMEMAGLHGPLFDRTSLRRFWTPAGYQGENRDHAMISEVLDPFPASGPHGMISLTTDDWHFIYTPSENRTRLYHWRTDPSEQINLASTPEGQKVCAELKERLVIYIKRSYRPWRETRYLLAFAGRDFSPDLEAKKPRLARTDGTTPPGSVQALFGSDPETSIHQQQIPEEEELKSLPYTAR